MPLHNRGGWIVEVVSSSTDGDAHASTRQFLCIRALRRCSQRQHVVITGSQNSQPLLQGLRLHVKAREPLVLILQGNSVIAKNQQPLPAPFTLAQEAKNSRIPQQV